MADSQRKAIRFFGVLLVAVGLLCISLNIVEIINARDVELMGEIIFNIGYGIWGGTLFFLCGLLGIVCSVGEPKRALENAFLVFSTLSVIISLFTVSLSIADVILGLIGYDTNVLPKPPLGKVALRLQMAYTLLIANVIGGILSLISSIICCTYIGCCCCPVVRHDIPVSSGGRNMRNGIDDAQKDLQLNTMPNQNQVYSASF